MILSYDKAITIESCNWIDFIYVAVVVVVVVVVVVEFTLLTSILSGITWTVACSESLVSSGKVDGRCGEVGCRQEVSSTAAVRRQSNLFSRIVPFDIEGPGVEPGTTTEGCALLECQMPDDATEDVAEHSSRLQPSINLHAPVTAFVFSCSGTKCTTPKGWRLG